MSEDRSFSPATESNSSVRSGAALINVNVIVQKLLQAITADDRGSIICRCDELPLVQGREEDYTTIFSTLLTIILHKKSEVPKCFLHIYCTADDEQVTVAGIKPFTIQFHTNSSPGADWLQRQQQAINDAAALLQKHGGSLLVNQLTHGGCIFSLSVLGKSL